MYLSLFYDLVKMKNIPIILFLIVLNSCIQKKDEQLSAQEIVDKSIEVSGGKSHNSHQVSFIFRGKKYISKIKDQREILTRITVTDSVIIKDVKKQDSFERYISDSLVAVSDSMATRYLNSINSVHYFARLPYGLNDKAVNKELLGVTKIKDKDYYKVKVTFSKENGGKDFDDTYVYWFNKETFTPDYLAYKFHVDGGGMRFREAFNERYVNNVRFVDYNNFKPKNRKTSIFKIDSLYNNGELELLSNILLDSINVLPVN